MTVNAAYACRIHVENIIGFVAKQTQNRVGDADIVYTQDNLIRLNSHSNFVLFNGIFDFDPAVNTLEKYLDEAIAYFSIHAQPFVWWWLKTSKPEAAVLKILNENYFESPGPYRCMLLDFREFTLSNTQLNRSVQVRRVSLLEGYEHFITICRSVFDLDNDATQVLYASLNPDLSRDVIHNYVAYVDGVPAGAVSAFFKSEVVGLYNCATLPDLRGKGILTTLLTQILIDAKRQNCRYAIAQLMAKNLAGGVFNKLGFKQVCTMQPFVYGIAAEFLEP